jgi:hypothetical protein
MTGLDIKASQLTGIAKNIAGGPLVVGANGFDSHGLPSIGAIPAGSVVVILGDSISIGYLGTAPGLLLSALPAFAGIPIYNFGVFGTTAGPTAETENSGLFILAAETCAYTKYLNGAVVATGSAAVSSLYPGTGNMYFLAAYGANDIAGAPEGATTLANFKTSMASIWSTARGYGANVKIIVTTITNQDYAVNGVTGEQFGFFNGYLRTPGLGDYLADVGSFFTQLNANSGAGDTWSPDGLHIYTIGGQVYAEFLACSILRPTVSPNNLGAPSGELANAVLAGNNEGSLDLFHGDGTVQLNMIGGGYFFLEGGAHINMYSANIEMGYGALLMNNGATLEDQDAGHYLFPNTDGAEAATGTDIIGTYPSLNVNSVLAGMIQFQDSAAGTLGVGLGSITSAQGLYASIGVPVNVTDAIPTTNGICINQSGTVGSLIYKTTNSGTIWTNIL